MIKLSELREAVDAPPDDLEANGLISDALCDIIAIWDERRRPRRMYADELLRDAGIEVDE